VNNQYDDLWGSFYLRAIRTEVGSVLRKQFVVMEPLPDRLIELLSELEETQDGAANGKLP
jgi:hypothetical protein